MAEDGSSGQRSTDNEWRFATIEQRLNGIDESLRNLTQTMAALTTQRRHEPIDRRPPDLRDHQHRRDDSNSNKGEADGGQQLPDRADLVAQNPGEAD